MDNVGALEDLEGDVVAVPEGPGGVPVLMVRRQGVRRTDFVAAFSARLRDIEQLPVKKSRGGHAEAVGLRVTLDDGQSFLAIANFEPIGEEVRLDGLKCRGRFATDHRGR